MDRKQFLKGAACGLCTCGTAGLAQAAGLETGGASQPQPDWRLPFVQGRYAALLGILSHRMDERQLEETLHALGTYCSSSGDEKLKGFHGDVDAFAKAVRQGVSGDLVTFDRERGVIVMASDERADCFCPLISVSAHTPAAACACSLGWQEHTWQTLLRRKVQVELKESVLRGGKRCVFEIRVGEPLPAENAG
jgi:hypothetical protein